MFYTLALSSHKSTGHPGPILCIIRHPPIQHSQQSPLLESNWVFIRLAPTLAPFIAGGPGGVVTYYLKGDQKNAYINIPQMSTMGQQLLLNL